MRPDGYLINKVFNMEWKYGETQFRIDNTNRIHKTNTGEALTVYEGKTKCAGVQVELGACTNNLNQQFEIEKEEDSDWFRLKNKESGLYLQVSRDGKDLSLQTDGIPGRVL